MPNQSNSIVLELEDLNINEGPVYAYSGLTGIDNNRSHSSQIQVLFLYTEFQNGDLVTDYTWENWYDPFVLPVQDPNGTQILEFDQSTQTVAIQDTSILEKVPVEGTSGLLVPAFADGDSVTIRRSQNISIPVTTFSGGSRITSTALNNAISQLFDSIQELEERVLKLESE